MNFDIQECQKTFSKIVRGINTANPNWKAECEAYITDAMSRYLELFIFERCLYQFVLSARREGQSLIVCELHYTARYGDTRHSETFTERLAKPREVEANVLSALGCFPITHRNSNGNGAGV